MGRRPDHQCREELRSYPRVTLARSRARCSVRNQNRPRLTTTRTVCERLATILLPNLVARAGTGKDQGGARTFLRPFNIEGHQTRLGRMCATEFQDRSLKSPGYPSIIDNQILRPLREMLTG